MFWYDETSPDSSRFASQISSEFGVIRQNTTGGGDMAKNELRFTVSPQLYKYLAWLKDNSVLGKTGNDGD